MSFNGHVRGVARCLIFTENVTGIADGAFFFDTLVLALGDGDGYRNAIGAVEYKTCSAEKTFEIFCVK
jgi:hypothetical protein